jgi:hypothetical protein
MFSHLPFLGDGIEISEGSWLSDLRKVLQRTPEGLYHPLQISCLRHPGHAAVKKGGF